MTFERIFKRVGKVVVVVAFLTGMTAQAQDLYLPGDFRQHNLTQFNASLVNPTFSFDWDQPRSVTAWARYQWESISGDPSTLLVNYSQRIGQRMSGGVGAFRHNTGIFQQQGGYINLAYAFPVGEDANIILGANGFIYDKAIADEEDLYIPLALLDVPALEATTGLVFSLQTGVRFQYKGFNAGLNVENTYDYNFGIDERETTNEMRVFNGIFSYDFPVSFGRNGEGLLRPIFYTESSGVDEFRFGGTLLFSSDKFWVQGGYNDFYGGSGGLGVTLFEKLSIGALIEIGVEAPTNDTDPTFELLTSYNFGKQTSIRKKKEKKNEELDAAIEAERQRALEEERRRRAIAEQDSIYQARLAEKRRLDSIARAEEERQRLEAMQAEKDQPIEKIEEVANADGLQPGYYLIANVFSTQKFFNQFMATLRREGLEPKYFYRGLNGYNYVYLDRYNTLGEAREARDTQFFGQYFGETWIFHVH